MAGCMRGVDDICEWSNALEIMEESKVEQDDMEIEVFRVLKYSYDSLKDRTVQQCFLYCSVFPEDHWIGRDELIEYLIDERLIDGMKSRQSKLNKGHTILNKLENVCLLEGGKYPPQNSRYVKMHDLIRDMAIQIASGSPRFLVEAGEGLRDMPEEKTWSEDLVRVSLMQNIISLPSNASPRCPRLLTLLLNQNRIESIPYCFFMYMNELTVLDLSVNIAIEQLPSSISNLRSLTALLLGGCEKLKYVPSLENLTALRRLDISFTEITELPQGIEMLVNLRYLNVEATYKLEKVPQGIFSKLSNLEYLKLCLGRNPKFRAEEISSLRKLDTFTGSFYDIVDLNTYVSSWEDIGLSSYHLFVGECFDYDHYSLLEYTIEKYVSLQMFNISKSKAGENSLVLPKDIQYLRIQECHDVTCLFDVASLENAIHLRMCEIVNCNGMKNLVGSSSCCRLPLLQSLESLCLRELFNLNDLIKGGLSISSTPSSGIFHSLKECYVYECHNLKSLFLPSLLLHLQQLERLIVINCKQMVEVIGEASNEDEDQEARRIIVFSYLPKLKDLTLGGLPELKNFCSKRIVLANSLQEISVTHCPKLRRIPVLCEEPHPLPSLRKIIVYAEWWNSLEWDYPHSKDFYQPFLSILGQQ